MQNQKTIEQLKKDLELAENELATARKHRTKGNGGIGNFYECVASVERIKRQIEKQNAAH